MILKISAEGIKVTSVPFLSIFSFSTRNGNSTSPSLNLIKYSFLLRQIRNSNQLDKALTTDTPTPCNPPEILYEFWSNLPPACSCVIITSAADTPSPSCISTGIPRPLSLTVTEPFLLIITRTRLQCPANASSIALSTTSYII